MLLSAAGMAEDYYELLGVPRDATEADVKKAFRRRARELHPDVNPDDPDAEARFKQVAEAYDVLSDPERRGVYDRLGPEGLRGAGAGPDFTGASVQDIFNAFFGGDIFGEAGPAGGKDVGAAVELDFLESATGATRVIPLELVSICGACEGNGAADGATLETCHECAGRGVRRTISRSIFGEIARESPCPVCGGQGEIPSERCPACAGRGRRVEAKDVEVEIPAGIANGQRVAFRGRGHAGEPGGHNGDLYVTVAVRPHPELERDGLDVVTSVSLPVTDAMLGTSVPVMTLEGERDVEIPAGTQPGEQIVLRGAGFPAIQSRGQGDQRVIVDVRVPRVEGPAAREAAEALAQAVGPDGYERSQDDSFFDRIRQALR